MKLYVPFPISCLCFQGKRKLLNLGVSSVSPQPMQQNTEKGRSSKATEGSQPKNTYFGGLYLWNMITWFLLTQEGQTTERRGKRKESEKWIGKMSKGAVSSTIGCFLSGKVHSSFSRLCVMAYFGHS